MFDKIIDNTKLDRETKNLFIIKKTFFLGDNINEADLLKNLNPLSSQTQYGKIQRVTISKNFIFQEKNLIKQKFFNK